MKTNRIRRRIRLLLAPPESRRGLYWKRFVQAYSRLRAASPVSAAARLLPPPLREKWKRRRRRRQLARLAPLRQQLDGILESCREVDQVIIFPPSLDWDTQLFQRPQQLALALARQGALVFYLQPKVAEGVEPFRPVQERMFLCNVPVEAFAALKKPTIYILTWNRGYASAFNSPEVIYDFVDEIEVFEGDHARMARDHARLVQSSKLVLATARRLHEQVLPLRPDALLCPNGVEYEHFAPARQPPAAPPPPDLEPVLAAGRPVVGYYGALAQWFDYELVKTLAAPRQDLSFLLIGPDYDGTLPPALLDLPNVYWLGVKPYAELPGYLRYFDVAAIPFRISDATHAVSPLKLFEYMAAAKPIVVTPMQESMRYPCVLVASDAGEFSRKIDEALQLAEDPEYLRQVEATAQENTWDARARQILDALLV